MARGEKGKRGKAALGAVEGVHRRRIVVVVAGLLAVYGAIAARLIQLQVDPDVRFTKEDLAHIGYDDIHRPRGDVRDRRGTVLATDRFVQSLSVDPSSVSNPEALIGFFASRLGVDGEVLARRFAQRDGDGNPLKYVRVKEELTEQDLSALEELSGTLEGKALIYRQEMRRFYPNGDVAAHVLGFANKEGVGVEGVELAYDQYLRSVPGRKVSRVDRNRKFLEFLTLEYEPASGGDTVYLTIDAELQYRLERALDAQMEELGAPRGMGVMMEPETGAILALASRPAFDPNYYSEYTAEARKNRAMVDVFEPGSAFKIVTASAALELGFITPNDLIDCEGGQFNPYGKMISDTHPQKIVPFRQCFAESSNIAMIKVAAVLGPDRLENWIRRYGFGAKTGVDLPTESAGIVNPRRRWSRLTMGSLPIGQEIAVTMLQLAQSFSVIANGGYLVRPHVVERVVSQEGVTTYRFDGGGSQDGRTTRVLSEETADVMKQLCYEVVAGKESTGRYAVIPEYRAGGKTGTAQIAKADGRGYEARKYTAVFAGFAPIRNPRVTCVIVLQEPKYGNHWGGFASGPVFKEVVRDALIRMSVPKDPMPLEDGDLAAKSAVARADADTVHARVEFEAAEPAALGVLDVSALAPGAVALELAPLELRPLAEDLRGGPKMPSLVGMTRKEAKEMLVELGMQWDPRGAGRVVEQYPPAGTALEGVTVCQLVFGNEPENLTTKNAMRTGRD